MKLVTAIIQPEKLPDVKAALFAAEIHKMTVSNVIGCGQQMGFKETYRGAVTEVNLLKKVRLDIAVNDDFVQRTIDAIIKGARSGKIGDGKIFVTALEECIRIRTGDKGKEAIGQPCGSGTGSRYALVGTPFLALGLIDGITVQPQWLVVAVKSHRYPLLERDETLINSLHKTTILVA